MNRWLLVLVLVATVASAWIVSRFIETPSDGPLPVAARVEIELFEDSGGPTTWGMPLPAIEASGVLRSVEALGVAGIEIVGVAACVGDTPQPNGDFNHCASIGGAWPPASVALRAVEGTALGPNPREAPGILIGARRLADADEGRIESVRIVYSVGWITYQVVQPWSLVLNPSLLP